MFQLLILTIGIAIMEASSQASIKAAREYKNNMWLIGGLIGYSVVSMLLYLSYKHEGMGVVNLIWSTMSIVMAMLFGIVLFKEKFDTNIAIAMMFAGLAIVFAYRHHIAHKGNA